jgi:methyltransferase (TIGR00027 family)
LRIGRELEAIGRAHDAIIARTCVIDERIGAAVTSGCERVVMLGAGLDTRPFRLSLPPIEWIEVDLPATIEWKQRTLSRERQRPVIHELIGADLTKDKSILERIDPKTLVIIEGMLVYLERPEAESLLRTIATKGARVIADVGARSRVPRLQRTARAAETRGAIFRTQIDHARSWFESLGYDVLADISLFDWDAARTDARWKRPFAALFRPMIRDIARVIDARGAAALT